jgi:hypothetical protein
MATVNEGFVADEDGIQEKSHTFTESKNLPLSKSIDLLGNEIDYSTARKAPLFIATIAGNANVHKLFIEEVLILIRDSFSCSFLGCFYSWKFSWMVVTCPASASTNS